MIREPNLRHACLLFVCERPEDNHYFPDLHHMKYELEDGTTPNGRELRFGFDPLEFPEFSWRGYAQMTPLQVRGRPHHASGELSPRPTPGLVSSWRIRECHGLGVGLDLTDKHIYGFHSFLLV